MTTQPAGEHHTGTLNLTGEGNAPASPISDEVVEVGYMAIAAEYNTRTDTVERLMRRDARNVLEAAYPTIRQQIAEEIAAAIEQQRDPDGFNIVVNLDATITKLAAIAREKART